MTLDTLTRRNFVKTSAAAAAFLSAPAVLSAESLQDRPNIVFLLTDDQRWDAMGCAGNSIIQTPMLDHLAHDGVRFSNAFCTSSICMSSRATIFTGLYTRSHGIESFQQPFEPDSFAWTYPAMLRKAGYHTGFIGKWGIGGPLPVDEFDYFTGFPGQGHFFHEVDGETRHLTSMLGDQSIDFLRNAPSEKPFCLSVSFKAPHVQDQHPDQFLYDPVFSSLYEDVEIPPPPAASVGHDDFFPESVSNLEARARWQIRFSNPELYQRMVRGYYRLITGVDAAIARIMEELDTMGKAENTIIFFTSDNGFYLGEYGLAGKWLMHEPSIRIPMIVYDPRLPASQRGLVRDEMVLTNDIAPTLLDWARLSIPTFMQGRSLASLAQGETPAWRDEWFYEHLYSHNGRIPQTEGVRDGRWKYTAYIDAEPKHEELFDLESDPVELRNLAGEEEYAGRLEFLRERHRIWLHHLENWKFDEEYHWRDPV